MLFIKECLQVILFIPEYSANFLLAPGSRQLIKKVIKIKLRGLRKEQNCQ